MLCKVTSKNQLTLPKEIFLQFSEREYFDAKMEDGHIVLELMIMRLVVSDRLRQIHAKVKASGLTEEASRLLIDEAKHALWH